MNVTTYTDEDIKIKFKKNEKLSVSGTIFQPWFWRDGELSYKEFTLLPKDKRDGYLLKLLSLPTDMLSTNDEYILNTFHKKHKSQPKENYFTLSEHKVELDPMTLDFLSLSFDDVKPNPTEENKTDNENEITL